MDELRAYATKLHFPVTDFEHVLQTEGRESKCQTDIYLPWYWYWGTGC